MGFGEVARERVREEKQRPLAWSAESEKPAPGSKVSTPDAKTIRFSFDEGRSVYSSSPWRSDSDSHQRIAIDARRRFIAYDAKLKYENMRRVYVFNLDDDASRKGLSMRPVYTFEREAPEHVGAIGFSELGTLDIALSHKRVLRTNIFTGAAADLTGRELRKAPSLAGPVSHYLGHENAEQTPTFIARLGAIEVPPTHQETVKRFRLVDTQGRPSPTLFDNKVDAELASDRDNDARLSGWHPLHSIKLMFTPEYHVEHTFVTATVPDEPTAADRYLPGR